MINFLMHSKGVNWIHFRRELDSINESFTVTFTQDGTVCMTGDYGCLSWRRNYFPEVQDYGFPFLDTHIGYFAGKVCQYGVGQQITEWDPKLACEEIREVFEITEEIEQLVYEDLLSSNLSKDELGKVKIADCLDEISNLEVYEECKMWDLLNEFADHEQRFGTKYTHHFKFMFEALQSVSEVIVKELK